jgi:hypothetical protein
MEPSKAGTSALESRPNDLGFTFLDFSPFRNHLVRLTAAFQPRRLIIAPAAVG